MATQSAVSYQDLAKNNADENSSGFVRDQVWVVVQFEI